MGSTRAGSNPAADVFSFNKHNSTRSGKTRSSHPSESRSLFVSSVVGRWDMSALFPATEQCSLHRTRGCMGDARDDGMSPCKQDMSFHHPTKPSRRARHTTRAGSPKGGSTREAENSCSMKRTLINSRRRSVSCRDFSSPLLLYITRSRSIEGHAEKGDSQTR